MTQAPLDRHLPADLYKSSVVLVTGGGTGLGRAIATEFGRLGATVVVASRNPEHWAQGVASVEAAGGRAVGVKIDIRDPAQVTEAFDAAERSVGPVSFLINNAAGNFFSPAEDLTVGGWSAVLDRVLTGTFLCSAEFARRRIAASGPGAIVNIASIAGLLGGPGVAHSGAAKAGVLNLTKSLAIEWARDGIRVNAIVPGVFIHDDGDPAVRAGRLNWEDADARVPLGRTGAPRELGWLATFLCSPYAGFITGQAIAIDGGLSLPRGLGHSLFTPTRERLQALAAGGGSDRSRD